MPRYIDADKLYEEMQYGILHEHYDKPFDLLAEILEAPTADVRENIKGRWIPHNRSHVCSVCGNPAGSIYIAEWLSKHCPWCGAEMRGCSMRI